MSKSKKSEDTTEEQTEGETKDVCEKFRECKETVKDHAQKAREWIGAGRERAAEYSERAAEQWSRGSTAVRERAREVDDKVHSDPWKAVAGTFVGGLLLGYILGLRRHKRRRSEDRD